MTNPKRNNRVNFARPPGNPTYWPTEDGKLSTKFTERFISSIKQAVAQSFSDILHMHTLCPNLVSTSKTEECTYPVFHWAKKQSWPFLWWFLSPFAFLVLLTGPHRFVWVEQYPPLRVYNSLSVFHAHTHANTHTILLNLRVILSWKIPPAMIGFSSILFPRLFLSWAEQFCLVKTNMSNNDNNNSTKSKYLGR